MRVGQCAWRMGIQRMSQVVGATGIVHRPEMTMRQANTVVHKFSVSLGLPWDSESELVRQATQQARWGRFSMGLLAITAASILPCHIMMMSNNASIATGLALNAIFTFGFLAASLDAHDQAVDIKRAIAVLYGNLPHGLPPAE